MGEGTLTPHSVAPWHLKEGVGHYRSRSAFTPPPGYSKCHEVRCVLHLDFVQHREGPNTPSVLHAVKRVQWVSSLLALLLLLSLLPLMLRLRLLFQAAGSVDEALSSPLHLIQQGEV